MLKNGAFNYNEHGREFWSSKHVLKIIELCNTRLSMCEVILKLSMCEVFFTSQISLTIVQSQRYNYLNIVQLQYFPTIDIK